MIEILHEPRAWGFDLTVDPAPPSHPPSSHVALRQRFHDAARQMIARELALDASVIEIRRDPHGRPFVVAPTDAAINISLARRDAVGMLALARSGRVGVDLEPLPAAIDVDTDINAVAADHFSPRERMQLDALPLPERRNQFLLRWTAKEALAKAIGHGFSLGLQGIETLADDRDRIRFASLHGSESLAAGWQLEHRHVLICDERFLVAVVHGG